MTMNMIYGLYFSKGFLLLMDEILEKEYNDSLKREDFLHLFYTIERVKEKKEIFLVDLPRDTRENFGRTKINGIMTWKFKELLDICIDKGILQTTSYSNFKGNNYCKAYGYTEQFTANVSSKELELQFCEVSEKTYNSLYSYYSKPTNSILLQHYNTICDLEIDVDKALAFAKTTDGKRLMRIVRDIATMNYKDRIIVTSDINTGRIFTTFNLMKSELREFCTYKGQKLDSLDLKSSQPYFLASILLKENPDNWEVQQFYKLVTQGDLYNWLIEKWGGFEDSHSPAEARKWVKTLFFNYLYRPIKGAAPAAEVLMANEQPEIYRLIKIKSRSEELWRTLQKIEADIFITVCNQFVDRGCLSVHDSLYFPIEIRGEVETALINQFKLNGFSDFKLI